MKNKILIIIFSLIILLFVYVSIGSLLLMWNDGLFENNENNYCNQTNFTMVINLTNLFNRTNQLLDDEKKRFSDGNYFNEREKI